MEYKIAISVSLISVCEETVSSKYTILQPKDFQIEP